MMGQQLLTLDLSCEVGFVSFGFEIMFLVDR